MSENARIAHGEWSMGADSFGVMLCGAVYSAAELLYSVSSGKHQARLFRHQPLPPSVLHAGSFSYGCLVL